MHAHTLSLTLTDLGPLITSSPVTSYHHTGGHINRQYKPTRAPKPSQNIYPASDYILKSVPQSGGFVIPQRSVVSGNGGTRTDHDTTRKPRLV